MNAPIEGFGSMRQGAAPFGNVPHDAEGFRRVPPPLDVELFDVPIREAVRLFEAAGVPRSERTLVNWCRQNRQGIARFRCYFEETERRYLITRESVEQVIAEEQARVAARGQEEAHGAPAPSTPATPANGEPARVKELELQVRDLTVATRVKDELLSQAERRELALLDKVEAQARLNGALETRLLAIEGPKDAPPEFSI